ncbi:CubicO group peptidase (beta-lactamase class C family) [Wenzhouxiangella marina]|nr:CubicO group peptidase (beta-lactamase class C family) [Wenzhouxiangella marina]
MATRIQDEVEHAASCADAGVDRELDARSRFEIGSISKALQGLLVAVLVERGELDLDQPVAEIWAEQTIPGDSEAPIRLRHLLTHTSGLPRLPTGFVPADMSNPYDGFDRSALLEALANTELEAKPGEAFAYSNFGAMLLAQALVDLTGQGLEALFDRHVFGPLGMEDTGLSGPTVQGHDASGEAVPNWDFDGDLGGVGAIRSTPADMAKWLVALLRPEGSELAAALERSQQALIEVGGQTVGYGWLHLPLGDGQVLAHDGGTGGFSSFAVVDPGHERASLILMDTSMLMQNSLADLAFHLIDPDYPLASPQRPALAAEGEVLEHYVGRYGLYQGDEPFLGDFTLDFTVDQGELLIQASVGGQVQPRIPLSSEGEGRFVQADLDLSIEFERDAAGQVVGLDFQQGPLSLDGRRQ